MSIMDRINAKQIADSTLKTMMKGSYDLLNVQYNLSKKINACVNNTVTIMDQDINRADEYSGSPLLGYHARFGNGISTRIKLPEAGFGVRSTPLNVEVTDESVLATISRLQHLHPCVLNFANATSPGGGFLSGAIAQEETIVRSSALYLAIKNSEYYDIHLKNKTDFYYTDTIIYSPDVPIFKNDSGNFVVEREACFVTSPAPMRASIESLWNDAPYELDEMLEAVLGSRIDKILKVMAAFNHKTIILGAWGCGAFGNDPYMVADLFKKKLMNNPFFDRIVFPVYGDKNNLKVFKEVFESSIENNLCRDNAKMK